MAAKPAESPNIEYQNALAARDLALRGDRLYEQGNFIVALELFQKALALQPNVADYHFRIASTSWKLGRGADVEKHYLESIRLDPQLAQAHKMLAQWYASQRQFELSLLHSSAALALSPDDLETLLTRAVAMDNSGDSSGAWELVQPLVAAGRVDRQLAIVYATLAQKYGHEAQAIEVIERTIHEAKPNAVGTRKLHVYAASLLEGMSRFDDAFVHMKAAKTLTPRLFNRQTYSTWISSQIEYFTPERVKALPHALNASRRPVWIVGMPRSGTSLIEQILASHPAVFGAGELRTLGTLGLPASTNTFARGMPFPKCFDRISMFDADRLAEVYAAEINALNSSATMVTDKMPHNYEYLALAQIIAPQSRVIHCCRDPRDTCLSCFLTDFDQGNSFSCDLDDLASYYRDYARLMDHWRSSLLLPILDVRYEDVVSDPRTQVGRMLEFLGLPWDEKCLAFYEHDRPVATASRDQVRRPLYSTSVGRWKNYEKNLGPLLSL